MECYSGRHNGALHLVGGYDAQAEYLAAYGSVQQRDEFCGRFGGRPSGRFCRQSEPNRPLGQQCGAIYPDQPHGAQIGVHFRYDFGCFGQQYQFFGYLFRRSHYGDQPVPIPDFIDFRSVGSQWHGGALDLFRDAACRFQLVACPDGHGLLSARYQ